MRGSLRQKSRRVLPRVLADLRMDRRRRRRRLCGFGAARWTEHRGARPAGGNPQRHSIRHCGQQRLAGRDRALPAPEILERLQNSFGRELIRRISFRLGDHARPGGYPAYFMLRAKCPQSGAPTCSRLGDREDAESRLKSALRTRKYEHPGYPLNTTTAVILEFVVRGHVK